MRHTIARSNIVDDGALVAVWPGVPVEGKLRASDDIGVEPSSSRALVTGDLVSAQRSRLDKTKVLVQGIPTRSLRPGVRRRIVPHRIRTIGPYFVGSDTTNETMGRYSVEEGGSSAQEE